MWFVTNNIDSHSIESELMFINITGLRMRSTDWKSSFKDIQSLFSTFESLRKGTIEIYYYYNHKKYNFLACDWFKKVLFSTNSLAKLLSDSLLLDSLLLDSLLSDSSISQSHSKM